MILDLLRNWTAAARKQLVTPWRRCWPGSTPLAVLARQRRLPGALRDEPLYKSLTRPRLRMVLEALEDSLRSNLGEGQPCPRSLTVEHVMPQAWRDHWDEGLDPVAALQRDRIVHSPGEPDAGQ